MGDPRRQVRASAFGLRCKATGRLFETSAYTTEAVVVEHLRHDSAPDGTTARYPLDSGTFCSTPCAAHYLYNPVNIPALPDAPCMLATQPDEAVAPGAGGL